MIPAMYGAIKCPDCGHIMYPGAQGVHECRLEDLLKHQAERAEDELRDDGNVAARLALWGDNPSSGGLPDCPDDERASLALPALRAFAEWQRQREDGCSTDS